MTIYIAHRQNELKNLKKLERSNFNGVEFDLRSNSEKIIMSHDPFKNGNDFLKKYRLLKNFFLIIDIKSSGISSKIYKLLKKNKYKFLLLNLIQPEFVQMVEKGYGKNLLLRFSSYEKIDISKKKLKKINWVWLDFFERHFITSKEYKYLKKFKKKICLTSPDLLGYKTELLKRYIAHLNKKKIRIDMVCVKEKNINIWRKYYNY